jgi:integrase
VNRTPYSVHKAFAGVNWSASIFPTFNGRIEPMTPAIFDHRGNRKYLIAQERQTFIYIASKRYEAVSTFCLTMAFTGARISEVLALTASRIDAADEAIIFETLKQRKVGTTANRLLTQ